MVKKYYDEKGQHFGSYNYYDQGNGFSAADMTALIPPGTIPGVTKTIPLGTIAMISISQHRDKFPVASLGSIGPKGYTAGHRTIGGTLAFNTIDRSAFSMLTRDSVDSWVRSALSSGSHLSPDYSAADELPPFNIIITAVNETGEASYSVIEGITILDEGTSYNLETIILMESYSFMALRRIPFQPVTPPRKEDGSLINNGIKI